MSSLFKSEKFPPIVLIHLKRLSTLFFRFTKFYFYFLSWQKKICGTSLLLSEVKSRDIRPSENCAMIRDESYADHASGETDLGEIYFFQPNIHIIDIIPPHGNTVQQQVVKNANW